MPRSSMFRPALGVWLRHHACGGRPVRSTPTTFPALVMMVALLFSGGARLCAQNADPAFSANHPRVSAEIRHPALPTAKRAASTHRPTPQVVPAVMLASISWEPEAFETVRSCLTHGESEEKAATRPLCEGGPLLTTMVTESSVAATTTDSTATEAVLRRFFRAYNAHDLEELGALMADDAAWMSLVGTSVRIEYHGRTELLAFLRSAFLRRPDTQSEVTSLLALGAFAILREVARWDRSDATRSQAAMAIYEVRDGRIQRVWYIE